MRIGSQLLVNVTKISRKSNSNPIKPSPNYNNLCKMKNMSMMPMQMTFSNTPFISHLLFKNWAIEGWTPCENHDNTTNTTGGHSHVSVCRYWWKSMAFAIIAIFLLAIATEALNILRVKLYKLQRLNPLKRAMETSTTRSDSDSINVESASTSTSLLAPLKIPSSVGQIKRRRFNFHILQSILYMFYRFSGYLLMLAAMSFNMYIFLAVIIGLGVGYFVLAPIRQPKATSPIQNSHTRGSRHGRGSWNESGNQSYTYGSL